MGFSHFGVFLFPFVALSKIVFDEFPVDRMPQIQYTDTLATPVIFSSSGMSSPGIFLSTMKVSLGSGESSGSSTMACLMLKPPFVRIIAEFAKMPCALASTGVISTTPRLRCLAISLSECPAGRISSNMSLISRLAFMVLTVSLTVRRSTPATRAIRTGGISIWLRKIFSSLTLKPFSTRTRATLSLSG